MSCWVVCLNINSSVSRQPAPTIPYLDCTTWGGCLYSGKSVKSASLRSVKMTVFQSGLSQVKYPAAASASSTFIILSAAVSVAPLLEKARHHKDCVAYPRFGHAVRAAGRAFVSLGVGHRQISFPASSRFSCSIFLCGGFPQILPSKAEGEHISSRRS